MKHIIIFISFTLLTIVPCRAFCVNVRIDPRIELTSIVFRLAGDEAYSADIPSSYVKDVDLYFNKYSSHPLITYLKHIRENNDKIGCSIAARSAFLFEIKNGHLKYNIKEDTSSIIQKYWYPESLRKYLQLLSQFYDDTQFEKFWGSQEARRRITLEYSKRTIQRINLDYKWMETFFNEQISDFYVYIAMLNGPCNYANVNNDHMSGKKDSIVLGCYDEIEECPVISINNEDVIIHELCHCLGNDIVAEAEKQIIDNFNIIFPSISETTKQYGYSSSVVAAGESLIDMFSIIYLINAKNNDCMWSIAQCEERGFYWMSDLVRFMENFHAHREIYPSIKEFMPQIVSYYKELPDRFDAIMKNNAAKAPYIESTYPARGSIVSSDIKEIRIIVSHPVIDAFGEKMLKGVEPIPHAKVTRTVDHKTIVVPIEGNLDKGKTYGMVINGRFIIAEDTHHNASKDYLLLFKTE